MKVRVPTLILIVSLLFASSAYCFRCNHDLVSEGDLKHEVLLACGEPFSREVIGFIDYKRSGHRIRVMKIEEWIIEEGRYYYSLIFEGNVLKKIESAGKKY